MKVVIAAYTFLPVVGGVSTTIAILARAFADAGNAVTVVTLSDGPTEGYGYQVIRCPGPACLLRAYRNADLVVLSNLSVRLFYPLLFLRRSFALQHHSESAFSLGYSPLDLLRRVIRSRATHFVTSEYIGQKSGLGSYVVTRPYPDSENINSAIIQPLQARNHALFVGRVEPEKGIIWLCERWSRVSEILGLATLRIVGSGSAVAVIEQGIRDGRWSNIELVGPLDRPETAKEMGRAACVFVPSLWQEPFGAVALEALAAGAIVISSDRGGLKEAGASLALYYDPDDEDAFIDAVKAARALLLEHAADPQARAHYLLEIEQHVDMFRPSRTVDAIIDEMAGNERRRA